MKSQTKAFLASVMVLALALSSIGGVTYSWFSDTETSNIQISTGSIKVDSIIREDGGEPINGGNTIPLTVGRFGETWISIKGEIKTTFPTDVVVEVITESYSITPPDGSPTVYVYPDNGNINTGNLIKTNWYKAYSNISFDGGNMFTPSGIGSYIHRTGTIDSHDFSVINWIHRHYVVYESVLLPNENGTITFSERLQINVGENFSMQDMPDLRIVITATQSQSQTISFSDNKAEATFSGDFRPKSVIFIDNDNDRSMYVRLPYDSICDVTSVKVEKTEVVNGNKTTITIHLKFFNGDTEVTSTVDGLITIRFNDFEQMNGSISLPAKDGLYTFIVGGSS